MASYVSLDNLQYYDTKLKAYLATKDAEVLARAGVTFEVAETPETGAAVTYVFYQNYTEAEGVKTKTEIGKLNIPLDAVLDGGSLVVTPGESGAAAKTELVFTLANTTDASTTSGKKEIRVDISSVTGDVAGLAAKVTALEATHATKVVEGNTVLQSVSEQIGNEAKNASYTVDENGAATETIGAAIARLENDLTYKGVATSEPADPKKGDLYNFNIAAVEGVSSAVTGWKFYDGAGWQSINDATLAERVAALETQVGKDKTVNAYESKSDLVDIVNVLTGASTVEGSVDEKIYNDAINAKYGTKAEDDGSTTVVTIKDKIDSIVADSSAASKVTIKTDVTTTGALKTYTIYQGDDSDADNKIGVIDIPKDFLVKSGSIVEFTDEDTLPTGVSAAGKYIALVINTAESESGSATDQTIYINVADLVDVYTTEQNAACVQLAISEQNVISATIKDASIAREKIDEDFEDDLAAIETAIGSDDDGLVAVTDRIKAEAKNATYKAAVAGNGSEGDADYVAPQAEVTIAQAIAALEASASDTNGAVVFKGEVTTLPIDDMAKGDTYLKDGILYTYYGTEFKEVGLTTAITGTGYKIAEADADIKAYIDSRIFVGSQQAYDDAIDAKTIDSTTLAIITDDAAEGFAPITEADIDAFGW